MSIARILVVDDEVQIRRLLRITLEANGYDVVEAAAGEEGVARSASASPDLIVLDLGLPGIGGHDVIDRVRAWSDVPIIVLSVRTAEREKIEALDRGADDYVTKPFATGELLARVRACLRARRGAHAADSILTVGDLEIDLAAHRVRRAGAEIRLTRKEFDLLHLLARHAGRIVTHPQLLRELWGPAHERDTHYLRIYVGQVRAKLGDDPAEPRYIANEPGVGYRLLLPDEAPGGKTLQ